MQIYTVFETLQSPFVGYHCKIKSLINYLIANLITFPGSRLCYAHCLKWADLRAPWADGRHGGLLRTSEKHFKGSGCAQTTLPPPMPFCQVRFLTWVFPGKCNPYVSDSLTLHLQREGPGSTIWLFRASFFFLDVGEQEELATGRKGKVRIFQGLEKRTSKEQRSMAPDPGWGHDRVWEKSFLGLLPAHSAVCQMAPLLRMPRTVGNFKLAVWPGGSSACLPMVRRTDWLTILGRGRRDLCFPHPYSTGLEEKGMKWTHNWQHSSCLQGWQEMWMSKSGSMWSGF